jgi:hypothetical protein
LIFSVFASCFALISLKEIPYWFSIADPDLAFYLNADPDPESQTNADLSCWIRIRIRI